MRTSSLQDANALYNSIKGLIARQDYSAALRHGWQLHGLLCEGCGTAKQNGVARSKGAASAAGAQPQLGPPSGDAYSQQRAKLLVGAVLSLLMSAVELRPSELAATVRSLLQPLTVLPAWLRLLSTSEAEQYGQLISQSLLKGVAQLAAKSSGADADATCSYAVAAVHWSAAAQPAASVAQGMQKLTAVLPPSDALQLVQTGMAALQKQGKALSEDELLRMLEKLASGALGTTAAADVAAHLQSLKEERVTGAAGVFAAALGCSAADVAGKDWAQRLLGAAESVRRLARSCHGGGQSPTPLNAVQQLTCLTVTLRAVGMLRKALPTEASVEMPPAAAAAAASALKCAGCLLQVAAGNGTGGIDIVKQYSNLVSRALVAAATFGVQAISAGAADAPVCGPADFACLLPDVLSSSCSERSPLGRQDLRWLCASVYNLGDQLVDGGHPAAAAALLQVACNAAVATLTSAGDGLEAQDVKPLRSKLARLARCQEQCGLASSSPRYIGNVIMAVLPFSSRDTSQLQPLLHAFVQARLAAVGPAQSAPSSKTSKPKGGRRRSPQQPAATGHGAVTLQALLVGAPQLPPELKDALLEEEAAVLCSLAASRRDPIIHGQLRDTMEALQQRASAGDRARLLVMQSRAALRSAAAPSSGEDDMAAVKEQQPIVLLQAALDAASEGGGAAAAAARGAAHCLLALQAARATLTAQHEAPCDPQHWAAAHGHAAEAAAAWQQGLQDAEAEAGAPCGAPRSQTWAVTCFADLLELSAMCGLQGITAEEQQLRATAERLQQPWPGTTAGCSGGAAQLGCAVCCIFALPCAAAQPAATTAAPSDQNGRQLPKAQRVVRHHAAAEAALQAGDIVSAQSEAHEAWRLACDLQACLETASADRRDGTSEAESLMGSQADSIGYWQLQGLRLAVLLQTGRLMELSSSPEEALWSFQEAHTLAEGLGAPVVAALCQAYAAEVHGRRGDTDAAQSALQQAAGAAAGIRCCPAVAAILRGRLAFANACCSRWSNDLEAAAGHCTAGLAALCEPNSSSGSGVQSCDSLSHSSSAGASVAWAAADLVLRLQLQHAKCLVAQGDPEGAVAILAEINNTHECHPVAAAAAAVLAASLSIPSHPDHTPAAADGAIILGYSGPSAERSRQKGRASSSSSKCRAGCSANGDLDSLLLAHRRCFHVPLLRRKAAELIADAAAANHLSHAALLFTHDRLGAALQQQYATVLDAKARQLQKQASSGGCDAEQPQVAEALTAVQQALQLVDTAALDSTGVEAGAQRSLEAAAMALGSDTAICSLSLSSRAAGGSAGSHLIVSRYVAGRPPLLVALPLQGLLEAAPASASKGVLTELADILSASDASLSPAATLATPAQKAGWWDTRIALDGRLAALQGRLDESLLGPWRCLLFGQPADAELAAALADAGAALAAQMQQLPRQRQGAVTLGNSPAADLPAVARELCAVLAAAAGEVSAVDAAVVLRHALRLAGHDGGAAEDWAADLTRHVAGIAGKHSAAAAAALADSMAALLLGRPGSCSLTFRERMDAEEAAFLGTVETARSAAETHAGPQRRRQTRRTAAAAAAADDAAQAAGAPRTAARGRRKAAAADAKLTLADISNAGGSPPGPPATPAPRTAPAKGRARPPPVTPATAAPARRSRTDRLGGMTAAPMTAVPAPRPRRRMGDPVAQDAEEPESRAPPMLAVLQSAADPAPAATVAPPARTAAAPARRRQQVAAEEAARRIARGPTLLVLDGRLQPLPWESSPSLSHLRMYRMPSLACAVAVAERRRRAVAAAGSGGGISSGGADGGNSGIIGSGADGGGGGSGSGGSTRGSGPDGGNTGIIGSGADGSDSGSGAEISGSASGSGPDGGGGGPRRAVATAPAAALDLGSTFYMLNPSGDLAMTQAAFEERFASLPGWEGTAGSAPEPLEVAAALQGHQLFVYLGHGGGEQYLARRALARLPRCAGALLMGCSSGRLRGHGAYDPSGTVLAYLLAGCPTAVANLWDVTDVDIDRFACGVLDQWLGEGDSTDAPLAAPESPRRRRTAAASGTMAWNGASAARGRGATPASKHAAAEEESQPGDGAPTAAAGPDGSGAGAGGGAGSSDFCIAASVAAARGVCRLRHLIGSAPVCYGVPTNVRRTC